MKRIVVIDDNRLTLQIARDMLVKEGFDVAVATNSGEAFNVILDGEKPSLLVMDVTMPLIEGDKIVVALKGSKQTADIPILFYSGRSSEELESLVKITGANGYLTKSASHEELISTVHNILNH